MQARKQLETRMKNDQYQFTVKPYQSIVNTSFGFLGFIISYGLWYKLRVYKCYVNDSGFFKISDPDEYEHKEKAKLLEIVADIKQKNQ